MQMLRLRVVSSFLRTEREREREKRNLHHERPLIFGSRGRRAIRSNFSRNYENESYLQIGETRLFSSSYYSFEGWERCLDNFVVKFA